MSSQVKYKLIAAFFLTVFSLNTILGFACSIGVDMGYNNKHHHKNKHHQEDDQEHALAPNFHNHSQKSTSHQKSGVNSHRHEQETPGQDDCCNKNAVEFQQVDKSLSHAAKINISTPVILLISQYAYSVSLLHFINNDTGKQYYFVRSDHPPIPDIRVAIQSFQI